MTDKLARLRQALNESQLLHAVGSIRADRGLDFALGSTAVRRLEPTEIAALERQGNWAEDWSRVRVAVDFQPAGVWHSRFHGDVVLGRFTQTLAVAPGLALPSGIQHSTVAHAVIGNDALVQDVALLARYVVGPGALLQGCGQIICESTTAFGNGRVLPLAIETGGRDVAAFAELDVELAATLARARARHDLLAEYRRLIDDYVARATSAFGIIGPGAVVRQTPLLRNTYLGPAARVEAATAITDSTLLSSPDEPVVVRTGACVESSLVQWGCRIETLAIVTGSVLTEHAHAERHGKVLNSLIGPNTGVAAGEVTASLLGPFVGFHHQAMLIAVFWPEGRGNVAYGANVGSNHTSRMPDQEFWPGEGAYLGLGTNIKYPSDFSQAPYTIVAMGLNTLPQKLAFPFALLNSPWAPCPEVSPAFNEIIPAWVLRENLYMLRRNEGKFRARNQARRTHFDFSVFRPATIELMRSACRRLSEVADVRDIYTERHIDGLGKNFMREVHRRPAIDRYRFFILHYALLGLLEHAQTLSIRQLGDLLTTPSDRQPWEHQRRILVEDFQLENAALALRLLPEMLEKVAFDVERSKAKDDRRGLRIVDDYAEAHTLAADDDFVRQSWAETRHLQERVKKLLQGMQ